MGTLGTAGDTGLNKGGKRVYDLRGIRDKG